MHAGIANQRFPLKSAAGGNVPGIPGSCATHNSTDLVRCPWNSILMSQSSTSQELCTRFAFVVFVVDYFRSTLPRADCMTTTKQKKYVCIIHGVYCSWFGGVVGLAPLYNVDRRIVILSFQSKHYKIEFMEMSHTQSNIFIFSILHPPIFSSL